jgi:hypothetical protein
MPKILVSVAALCVGIWVFPIASAMAQADAGCIETELADPPRLAFECANGLVFEAEIAAKLQSAASADGTGPDAINLTGSAVFIDLPSGNGSFQVQTPFAIASVRGTQFIVDVQDAQTSVFVREGIVSVTRADGSDAVDLAVGEGVDVAEGIPLVVRNWPDERITALLSRFAR